MIKAPQINALGEKQFHYITAITKPQIETLLAQGTFQMTLFDEPLAEITTPEGGAISCAVIRYGLRKSPPHARINTAPCATPWWPPITISQPINAPTRPSP